MDLYSGLPYWIVKNKLFNYYNPLKENLSIDVAVVGSGITGSLVAHELCKAGIGCAVFDKRTVSTGSSAASTSLLQYEIDVPLCEMAELIGEEKAAKAYQFSLQSVFDIEKVLKETKIDSGFEKHSNIWMASYKKDVKLLEKEFEIRQKHGIPVEFLDEEKLFVKHKIKAPGALKNHEAAQMDCYKAATELLKLHLKKKELRLFSHTEIVKWKPAKNGYELLSGNGKTIKCKFLVIAAGYEAGKFLPEKVMDLNSTYALISKPVDEHELWPEKSLIWETKTPYFYMRTTNDNRMIIGGEDEEFNNPEKRDDLLREKVRKLEKQFKKTYPEIPFETEMAWCGTFSSTKDGLPFIGEWPGKKKMLFGLGYGGNGITFSMIAAQMIRNLIAGKPDERKEIFGFERML
jgi:glycine/D-amino acid oxidase-like deaminating enzyme